MNQLRKGDLYPFKIWLVLALSSVLIGVGTQAIAKPRRVGPTLTEVAPPSTYGTNFTGTVKRYLLNPQGVVDGLMLDNGLEVRFAPHMTDSLVATVKIGDRITLTGNPGVPSNFGQEVQAYSITNTRTQRTVVEQPSADPPPPPTYVNYSNFSVEGTADRWLVGRQGKVNGILLSNGTQVNFPPHIGYQLLNFARVGATVQAQGFGTSNSYGKVLEATSLKVAGQTISIYGAPPGYPPGALPAYAPPPTAPGVPPAKGTPPQPPAPGVPPD